MIDRVNDFKAQTPSSLREQLPVGAYGAVIQAADLLAFESRTTGQTLRKLRISFDIDSGEYKDFFKFDFEANTFNDRKWRGIFDIWLPKNDGSDKDKWTIRGLEKAIGAVESSNEGYVWDWNEKSLVGKKVGICMRNEQWASRDGRSGWSIRCGGFCDYSDALSGRVAPMRDKALKNPPASASSTFTPLSEENEEELPF